MDRIIVGWVHRFFIKVKFGGLKPIHESKVHTKHEKR